MAKVIDTNIQSQSVSNYFPAVQVIIIGAILGLLFWFFNLLIGRYTNSISVSGDIATILVATVGLVVMVTMRMSRPIIIILSSAATLWGLSVWTEGLQLAETIAWDVSLYILVYGLFSWLSRYSKTVPLIMVIVVIIISARVAISL